MVENGSEPLQFEPPERENARLREENARLRRLLAVHGIAIPQPAPENPPSTTAEPVPIVDREERARKRLALFRSLFRGREDVHARRWENSGGWRHSIRDEVKNRARVKVAGDGMSVPYGGHAGAVVQVSDGALCLHLRQISNTSNSDYATKNANFYRISHASEKKRAFRAKLKSEILRTTPPPPRAYLNHSKKPPWRRRR